MTAWQKVTSAVAGAGTLLSAILIPDWSSFFEKTHRFNILLEQADSIEHLIEDSHEVLSVRLKMDSMNRELDSLKEVMIIMNHGKFPYDTIWVKGPSGFYYMTTIPEYMTDD